MTSLSTAAPKTTAPSKHTAVSPPKPSEAANPPTPSEGRSAVDVAKGEGPSPSKRKVRDPEDSDASIDLESLDDSDEEGVVMRTSTGSSPGSNKGRVSGSGAALSKTSPSAGMASKPRSAFAALESESDDDDNGATMGEAAARRKATAARSAAKPSTLLQWDDADEPKSKPILKPAAQSFASALDEEPAIEIDDDIEAFEIDDDDDGGAW